MSELKLDTNTKEQIFEILFSCSNAQQSISNNNKSLEKIFCYSRLESKFLNFCSSSEQKKRVTKQKKQRDIQSLLAMGVYSEIANLLTKKNIFFMPLKGIQLNLEFYENMNDRNIRDVDLLIQETDLQLVLQILEEHNYFFEDKELRLSDYSFENHRYDIPPITNESGIRIEFHLRILHKNIDPDNKFAARAITTCKKIRYGNNEVSVMSYELLTLHLIYHSTIKEYFDNGLICLLDIKKMNEKIILDQNEILFIAKNYQLFKSTSAVFSILKKRGIIEGLNQKKYHIYKEKNLDDFEELLIYNMPDPYFSSFINIILNPALIFQSLKRFSKDKGQKERVSLKLNKIFTKCVKFFVDKNFRSKIIKSHRMKKLLTD